MNPFQNLTPLKYGVILADPPWLYKNYSHKGTKKGAVAQYDCMDMESIKALPVNHLAKPDCALVMWATAPMLPQAIDTMKVWGFEFKSSGAWAKQSSTGKKWAFGTGYLYRGAVEFWLLGTIGRPKQKSKSVRNLIVAPTREHSRKPDQMRSDIETLWDGPYLELFAREPAKGWDAWGNQTDKFVVAA